MSGNSSQVLEEYSTVADLEICKGDSDKLCACEKFGMPRPFLVKPRPHMHTIAPRVYKEGGRVSHSVDR